MGPFGESSRHDCPPIITHLTDFGDFPLVGRDVRVGNLAWGYGPRRRQLDQGLVEAAIEAGVEFRPNFLVENLVWSGDRVQGIRAPHYEETPALTCWYFSYWSGLPTEGFEMYVRDRRAIFSFSTNDDLFAIFITWPIEEFHSVKADIEGKFMRIVDLVPEFSERVRCGRREERFYGRADVPSLLRRPFGPGWALVGDAGCHKDPFMALGICDAFRDAGFLAAAVHEGLAGRNPLDEEFLRYERRRNEATMADYRENIARARFHPMPAKLLQLRAALRGSPEDTRRFIMAREGMIPHQEFFNAENLERILKKSAVAQMVPTTVASRASTQNVYEETRNVRTNTTN